MNSIVKYNYDNYDDDIFDFDVRIRNGASFMFCGCLVKCLRGENKCIMIKVMGSNISEQEERDIINKTAKLLSYIFGIPIYGKDNFSYIHDCNIEVNNSLSKRSLNIIDFVEKRINKFSKTKEFFYETLDLLMIANNNNFNEKTEDAFFYYFKIIEKISKRYYLTYMQRHHTKSATSNNKKELRKLINNYAKDNLCVILTDDMLNTKIDLIYKNMKTEFYGSIFTKISLFVTKEGIKTNLNDINKMVKVRNKIAHGDIIQNNDLYKFNEGCTNLATEMFSVYFFRKSYKDLNIKSKRYYLNEEF